MPEYLTDRERQYFDETYDAMHKLTDERYDNQVPDPVVIDAPIRESDDEFFQELEEMSDASYDRMLDEWTGRTNSGTAPAAKSGVNSDVVTDVTYKPAYYDDRGYNQDHADHNGILDPLWRPEGSDGGLTGGAIAGIVLGSLAVVGLLVLAIWWWCKKRPSREIRTEINRIETEILTLEPVTRPSNAMIAKNSGSSAKAVYCQDDSAAPCLVSDELLRRRLPTMDDSYAPAPNGLPLPLHAVVYGCVIQLVCIGLFYFLYKRCKRAETSSTRRQGLIPLYNVD